MFGTILGALPRPVAGDGGSLESDDDAVRAAVAAQQGAGLEPVTDGRLRWPNPLGPLGGLPGITTGVRGDGHGLRATAAPTWEGPLTVADWAFTAGVTRHAVKQVLPGPFTAGRRIEPGPLGRERLTLGLAEALNAEIAALTRAGCPLVEIDEPDVTVIGSDDSERRLFVEAHRRLTGDLSGTHLSLAVTGGNADTAGVGIFIDAPYASYAFDLIAGPDNWRLVVLIPGDRGIICGALDSRPGSDDSVELLAWAAHYAASTNGRGLERVGLATVPGLDGQDWSTVSRKLTRLGKAVGVAGLSGDAFAASIDPRAVDIRSAALGRYEPGRCRQGHPKPGRTGPGRSKPRGRG